MPFLHNSTATPTAGALWCFQHQYDRHGRIRRALTNVQVSVMGEAGEHYLVVAGYVEAEFAQAEIGTGLRPAIQNGPMVAVLNLVDDFLGAYADLECAEAFLVAFIGDYDLVGFLSVANYGAIKVVVVQLEKDVVFRVVIVEHPLQEVTLRKHRGKHKCARSRNGSVEYEVPSFASKGVSLMLPCARVIPLRHTAWGEG